jgi:hypothetical protein
MDLPLLWLLAALAVSAVIVVGCSRPPADPATPAGAVRAYLEALKDGEVETAYARFTSGRQAECDLASLKSRSVEFRQTLDDASVVVRKTTIDRESATVQTTVNGGRADFSPLGPRTSGGWDVWYRLVKVGDEWRLAEFIWPIYGCPDFRKLPVEPALTPAPAGTTP